MADRISVAVVDSHPLFRQGLASAMTGSRLTVVVEGATADDMRGAVRKNKPDIVLLDIGISGGISAAKEILKLRPATKVVILTASEQEQDVTDALRIGVHGYILKDVSGPELINALESIHLGQPYITPGLASRLLMQTRGRPLLELETTEFQLTPRDKQILGHLAKGLTNQEIAQSLNVNVRTIKHHLTQVFRKMRVRNRVEAILEAQKMKLDLNGRAHASM